MRHGDNHDKWGSGKGSLNRRSILLGGTTLAAASALGANVPMQVARAQQLPAAQAGPNIHRR
jgi:arylsulfatase